MRLRTLVIAVVALGVVVGGMASMASAKRVYVPRQGKRCKPGYAQQHRFVKRHRYYKRIRICVKKRRAMAVAPRVVKLHAHLDPSYTRDPLNPFKVTYAYSASATQEVASASTSTEEPAALPAGVLALYSDGTLECAVNVGGSVTGNECPVTYQALGEHRVTTIYSSGEQSATATEVENIAPLATRTSLSVSYEPLAPSRVGNGTGGGWWRIGTLSASVSAEPDAVTAHLDCGEGPTGGSGNVTNSGCYILHGTEWSVYAWVQGECNAPEVTEVVFGEPSDTTTAKTGDIEAGTFHLRATVETGPMSGNIGYAPSEQATPLLFTPQGPAAIC